MSDNGQAEEPKKPEASIEVTADAMIVKCPLTDKILVYGILEAAKEEAAKFFFHKQRIASEIKKASEESGRGILSRLNLPGMGRKH